MMGDDAGRVAVFAGLGVRVIQLIYNYNGPNQLGDGSMVPENGGRTDFGRDVVAVAEDVVRHIEHAVQVCGEEHVGIGTDGGTTAVDDLDAAYALWSRARVWEPSHARDLLAHP